MNSPGTMCSRRRRVTEHDAPEVHARMLASDGAKRVDGPFHVVKAVSESVGTAIASSWKPRFVSIGSIRFVTSFEMNDDDVVVVVVIVVVAGDGEMAEAPAAVARPK